MASWDNRVAPPPKNFRAMSDAANDPTEFARQKALYAQQLREEGFYVEDEIEVEPEPVVVGDRYRDRKDLDL